MTETRPRPFPLANEPHDVDQVKARLAACVELRNRALDEGRFDDYDLFVASIDRWLGRLSYLLPEPAEAPA